MADFVSLLANACVEGAAVSLDHRDLPLARIVSGSPRVASAELGRLGDRAFGVWEHTVGASTDIEVDEFFIVLSGAARVDFDDGSRPLLLHAGSATTWTVTATLRKIHMA